MLNLHPGDMVTENGVEHMVLRVFPGNIVRIRRWPIAPAPWARDVEADTVVFVERPGISGGKNE